MSETLTDGKIACLPDTPEVGGVSVRDESEAVAKGCELILGYRQQRLCVWHPGGHESPVSVDFGYGSLNGSQGHGALGYRLAADRVRHERVVRAVGKCPEQGRLVDATAGLGRDSALLAAAGWQVVMLERQPVLQALLRDGLSRAGDFATRMTLEAGDSRDWLVGHPDSMDVVYLDPMFPQRSKSAAIKKELLWVQQLCSVDSQQDEQVLLSAGLVCARRRVVVKRPLRAPPLAGVAPASSLTGKTVRFDIYPK